MTDREKLVKIAEYYGIDKQEIKLMEELAEVIQIMSKINLCISCGLEIHSLIESLAEEIADAEIMLEQIRYLYDIEMDVAGIKGAKLDRQLRRIADDD